MSHKEYKTTEENEKSKENDKFNDLEGSYTSLCQQLIISSREENIPETQKLLFLISSCLSELFERKDDSKIIIKKIETMIETSGLINIIILPILNENVTDLIPNCVEVLFTLSFCGDSLHAIDTIEAFCSIVMYITDAPRMKLVKAVTVLSSLIRYQENIDPLIEALPDIVGKLATFPAPVSLYSMIVKSILAKFKTPDFFELIVNGFSTFIDDFPFPETSDCLMEMIKIEPSVIDLFAQRRIIEKVIKNISESNEPSSAALLLLSEIASHDKVKLVCQYNVFPTVVRFLQSKDDEERRSSLIFIRAIIPQMLEPFLTYIPCEYFAKACIDCYACCPYHVKLEALLTIQKMIFLENDEFIVALVQNEFIECSVEYIVDESQREFTKEILTTLNRLHSFMILHHADAKSDIIEALSSNDDIKDKLYEIANSDDTEIREDANDLFNIMQ